jgi:hypothetical protein
MTRYYVTIQVDFSGHIEAEDREEAEKLAWTSWGDTMDNDLTYDGVNDITVEEDPEEDYEEDEDE